MSVLKMSELDLKGKRVLIREDLNVPFKDGKITSDVNATTNAIGAVKAWLVDQFRAEN